MLPERDIVPLRTRWRDDKMFLVCAIVATMLWIATIATAIAFSVVKPSFREPPIKARVSSPR